MSQTRRLRKPDLKLVTTAAVTESNKDSRIMHDARGTAVWVGESVAFEELSSLTLAAEPSATRALDGDPYNRPASALGSRAAAPLKASQVKRRR
jgi:hypothetical protein